MGDTTIDWTDKTWNPTTGCSKVSQGCKNCYAERIFHRPYPGRAFTDVRTHPDRLEQPLRWHKPCRIFVNSMSDLFHEDVPDEFILRVFDVMRRCTPEGGAGAGTIGDDEREGHVFQVLTKRAERMQRFMSRLHWDSAAGLTLDGPGYNFARLTRAIWLGVSVEDQATADERIPLLLKTQATVRFVSYEPALGAVDFAAAAAMDRNHETGYEESDTGASICEECETNPGIGIDWLIAGGESGPRARPSNPDWFRSARDQCEAAGVVFFFKQWGEYMPVSEILRSGDILMTGALAAQMRKVGKKAAGHLLDNREHREYP